MDSKKTLIRFFTIADYEEEEIWLHNQHKNGWKLEKIIFPCFYIFEKRCQRRILSAMARYFLIMNQG